MIPKKTLYVSIFGPPNIGRSSVTQLLEQSLKSNGIETQVSWEIDGPPTNESKIIDKLKAITSKTKVVITETQTKRIPTHRHESIDDYQVRVYYVVGYGYGVSLTIQGITLKHDFGEKFPVLKERARSVAARLANELGVDVIDEIPTKD